MPLAHLVDPFKQVNLVVRDEAAANSRNASEDMLVDEVNDCGDQRGENAKDNDNELQEIAVQDITRPGCEMRVHHILNC